MAFNPFDIVRKRSKAIFAVLGIVVMLTFVLSAGAGMGQGLDFFDQIGGLFGSRNSGDAMAEAYGKEITSRELDEIRQQRTLANAFMLEATDIASVRQAEDINNSLKDSKVNKETRDALQRLVNLKINSRKGGKEGNEYLAYIPRILGHLFGQQSEESFRLMTASRKATPGSEDQNLLNTMTEMAMRDFSRARGGRRELYFQTPFMPLGIETSRELVDFALLLKKADQLGITYSTNAVDQLIESETKGKFSTKGPDWNTIEGNLRERNKELNTQWLKTAIANEYRVRTVLTILMGNVPSGSLPGMAATVSDIPGSLTPYEFYEYYKDNCSEYNFTLLELSAKDFLSQVTGSPTQKEREELFKKYANEEPDPSRERPGFKEPRKVKVEFVTLDPKDKRIADALPKLQAGKTILNAFAAATSFGGNLIPTQVGVVCAQREDELTVKGLVQKRMDEAKAPYMPSDQFYFRPRDASIYQPLPIISLMGALAGTPNLATAWTARGLTLRQIELADAKVRVPMQIQALLVPFNPNMGNLLGSPALSYAHAHKPLPESIYWSEEQAKHRKELLRETFEMDVRQLSTKMAELMRDASPFSGKPDKAKAEKAKAEARKYIDQWAKERNLTIRGNKEARDKWTLTTDPDLKVLNDLATPDPEGTNSFSKKFYEVHDFRQFGMGTPLQVSPFHPERFPSESPPSFMDEEDKVDKPYHLVWLANEVEPSTYLNLTNANNRTGGAMTKRVDDAWRLEKARDLAKAEAESIAQKMRDITKSMGTDPLGVDKQLRDLAAQTKARKLEIDRLAKLKETPGPTNPRDTTYSPPTIDKFLVTYPTPNFATQLLEMRTKPLGEVTIVHDAPRTKYYIATLAAKREKTVDEFRKVFVKSSIVEETGRDPLYGRFALDQERGKAIREVLDRLKAEANFKETEAFKKRDKSATDEGGQ